MRDLFILIAHLLTTLVRLAQPGGVGAVAAQSLSIRHLLGGEFAIMRPLAS